MGIEQTWFGCVSSPRDSYILLEACRTGVLPKVTRRLTDMERMRLIRPGAVFIWSEEEAGIKRWTDSFKWSPSRVSGAFLIYSELPAEGDTKAPGSGLFKQSFSSNTRDGSKMHLIAYYDKESLDNGQLPQVSNDPRLQNLTIPAGIYPDHRAAGPLDQPLTNVFPTFQPPGPSVFRRGSSRSSPESPTMPDPIDSRPPSRSSASGSMLPFHPDRDMSLLRQAATIVNSPPQSLSSGYAMSEEAYRNLPMRRSSSSSHLLSYNFAAPMPERRPSSSASSIRTGPSYSNYSPVSSRNTSPPASSIRRRSSIEDASKLPPLSSIMDYSDVPGSLYQTRRSLPYSTVHPDPPLIPPRLSLPEVRGASPWSRRVSEQLTPISLSRRSSYDSDLSRAPLQGRSSEDVRQLSLLSKGLTF